MFAVQTQKEIRFLFCSPEVVKGGSGLAKGTLCREDLKKLSLENQLMVSGHINGDQVIILTTSQDASSSTEVNTFLNILNLKGETQSQHAYFKVNTSMVVVRQLAKSIEFIGVASSINPASRYLFSLKVDLQSQNQDDKPLLTKIMELDQHVCPSSIEIDVDADNLYIASICGQVDNHVFIVALGQELKKAALSRKILIEELTNFELCPLRDSFALIDKKDKSIFLYSRSKPLRAVRQYPFSILGLQQIVMVSCDRHRNFIQIVAEAKDQQGETSLRMVSYRIDDETDPLVRVH